MKQSFFNAGMCMCCCMFSKHVEDDALAYLH